EASRRSLMRLLSQLVERQLVAATSPSGEGRDDRDAERRAGGRAGDERANGGGAAVGAALREGPAVAPGSDGAGVRPPVDAPAGARSPGVDPAPVRPDGPRAGSRVGRR